MCPKNNEDVVCITIKNLLINYLEKDREYTFRMAFTED
jgi:hypothetical protein